MTTTKKLAEKEETVSYTEPHFDFRYLEIIPGQGFYELSKNKNNRQIFRELQTFLYVSSQEFSDLDKIIGAYTSPKGSRISSKESEYVRNILKAMKLNSSEKDEVINSFLRKGEEKSLTHIHLRKNGKGKCVMFGYKYEKTFYVLAIDPEHKFNKK